MRWRTRPFAEHGAQSWHDAFFLELLVTIRVRAKLEIHPPEIVGLLVQQSRFAVMERRIEPEPAFGRKVAAHDDVGDEKPIVERRADER